MTSSSSTDITTAPSKSSSKKRSRSPNTEAVDDAVRTAKKSAKTAQDTADGITPDPTERSERRKRQTEEKGIASRKKEREGEGDVGV